MSKGKWSPARVRFWESGRRKQTPCALNLGLGWRPVRLLEEELRAGLESKAPYERRYLVELPEGRRIWLSGIGEDWRVWESNALED